MSMLSGILSRLNQLKTINEEGNEPNQRFFEIDGEKKCSVKYFQHNSTFEVEVYQAGEKPKVFQYDNIDIAAIDIFDVISQ
jgi:uncharacterized protein YkuJ